MQIYKTVFDTQAHINNKVNCVHKGINRNNGLLLVKVLNKIPINKRFLFEIKRTHRRCKLLPRTISEPKNYWFNQFLYPISCAVVMTLRTNRRAYTLPLYIYIYIYIYNKHSFRCTTHKCVSSALRACCSRTILYLLCRENYSESNV